MSEQLKEIVYSRDTIEFVTVALQYCAFLEELESMSQDDMTDKLTKVLPLLYLKASLVPPSEMYSDDEPEISVTEDDYNYILSKIYAVFAENDTYLEVFMEDMKYSETPIAASISEDLADIYQDLRNFITVYERGITENMNDALTLCIDNFKMYWGQKLVNVLRALHSLKYSFNLSETDDHDHLMEETDELW